MPNFLPLGLHQFILPRAMHESVYFLTALPTECITIFWNFCHFDCWEIRIGKFQNTVSKFRWEMQTRKIGQIQPMANEFSCVHCVPLTPNFSIVVWSETSSPERVSNLPKVAQVVSGGTSLQYSTQAHGAFIPRWSNMGTASPSSPPNSRLKFHLVILLVTCLVGPLVYCTWH